MNGELLAVLEHIERERGIDKDLLFKAIESALVSAARKIVGDKEAEVSVVIDRKTGEIKINSGGKVLASEEFGRIAAQTAKQVIIQKIREAERDIVSDEYTRRVGTITSGTVHRFEKGSIVIDLGKTEAVLPKSQQSPGEHYRQGDRIRALILEVTKTVHGPQIVLSRSDAAFVKKLFEIEVPEITENVVEVRAISREAGERTKLAVWSKDEKIDPVGACVGMRGSRVKDIVRELNGERIDIVRWNDDIKEYVKAALNPAEITEMRIDKANKKIQVTLPDDQLSIGIGKHGQNVRLASRLIGWEIDIKKKEAAVKQEVVSEPEIKEVAATEAVEEESVSVSDLAGVGKKTAKILIEAGFDTIEKIRNATAEDLTKLEGIGQKTAEKIITSAKQKE